MPEPEERVRFVIDEEILNRARREREEIIANVRNQRRGNINGTVLDTIGIEIESIALSREMVSKLLSKIPRELAGNFKVHRDGSAEMNAYFVKTGEGRNQRYILVNAHTKEVEKLFRGVATLDTVGYELISIPMDIKTAELSLHALLPTLEYNGDFLSERCATHIHIGGMKNLQFLKNCLNLGLWFDEVFYSLAGMGKQFRGYSNNAIYARPLQNGPYFNYDGDYYQVLNLKRALEANDIYEFYCAYGVNINRELGKYHPGRYFSINLYSIPRIGTVEFRHFNQSFNPALVTAIAKLCQIFVEIAIKGRNKEIASLEPGDVFQLYSPSHYLNKLYKFLDLAGKYDCKYNLNGGDVTELERIIYSYNGIGIENVAVLTHCTDLNIEYEIIKDGRLIKTKAKPIKAGQTTIHNIKYESILGK